MRTPPCIPEGVLVSTSRDILILSKREPKNGPEYSDALYLYGNHWRCGASQQSPLIRPAKAEEAYRPVTAKG